MTREMVLEMRGVPRRRGARGRIAAAAVVALLGLLALPAAAGAVGQPGTTYSLQIGRGATETSIQRIAPDGSVSPVPAINGPGVEPLNAPVGITVDAEGCLIVADADGYEHAAYCGYVDVGGPVNPGCGAILRINPDTGATQVLSTGDKHANPYSVLLPPDGSITNGGDDSLIISDSAEGLIRLDPHAPFNAGESYMPSGTQDLSHSRGNWGLARDPVTGDILATNSGVPGVPLSGPGCETPQTTGYIARYSSDGTFERYYCDPRITAPRGIEFDSTGTAYVVDPITRNADESYGALLEITPQDQINYKAAGDLFRAPSGVAIDYSGSRLLVADEISGGGSVLAVDGFGGDQSAVAAIGSFPIDLAVDRRGAESSNLDFAIPAQIKVPKKPKKKHKKKPKKKKIKLQYTRVSAFDDNPKGSDAYYDGSQTTGLKLLNFEAVEPGSKILFECLDSDCTSSAGGPLDGKVVQTAPGDGKLALSFQSTGLVGKFRIFSYFDSTTKGRSIGFVKDFKAELIGPSIAVSDGSRCQVLPVYKVKGGKAPKVKRACTTQAQIIAKDKRVLRKLLTRKVVGGKKGGR